MHSQLINTLRGGKSPSSYLRFAFSPFFDASFLGLDCFALGSNPRIWSPRWCQIMQIVSFKSHSQILPTVSASLLCSLHALAPMSFLLPAVPQVFLPHPVITV